MLITRSLSLSAISQAAWGGVYISEYLDYKKVEQKGQRLLLEFTLLLAVRTEVKAFFFLEDPSLTALLALTEPFSLSLELITMTSSGSVTAATASGPCSSWALASLGASLPSMISAVDFCKVARVKGLIQNTITLDLGTESNRKTGEMNFATLLSAAACALASCCAPKLLQGWANYAWQTEGE